MAKRASSSCSVAAEAPATDSRKTESSYRIVERVKDFEQDIRARPDFDLSGSPVEVTKSPDPSWSFGQDVRSSSAATGADPPSHIEIDPYGPDRPLINNYKILISGIAPRPIGFISTVAADGNTKHLAPFSYFQVINHDPPMFVVGFSSRPGRVKDTFKNLKDAVKPARAQESVFSIEGKAVDIKEFPIMPELV
ncbi:Putative nitrilotriacetate monooxygenase component b [Tolypocladium paradoxum]|uniref:Nitrilotriacetate monooxygenase component b n=1 Tax=Tolypocladium paradoxum TaxID=94208 RepID=A0A2S4L020_9HYPO|nr:Putative nitrilotriacetate monooxygenase component b [Tolypocladium paradoxum]